MKALRSLTVLSCVVLLSSSAFGQDAVKTDPTHYKVVFENASVRVLRITYAAGAKSATHSHPDTIVVPLTSAKVRFTTPDGKSQDADMTAETAMYSAAETHTVLNTGKGPVDGLLVEFKGAAPGKATLPASRPGLAMKVLSEGPHGMAYRTTAEPTFHEAAGSKHDFDQVVIAMGPSPLSLSIDGKPAKTSWQRGDAVFIGRGVPHEAQNTGGKPVDMVIVAIK
jgi:quercetin dioxygenase-like cupin family protein